MKVMLKLIEDDVEVKLNNTTQMSTLKEYIVNDIEELDITDIIETCSKNLVDVFKTHNMHIEVLNYVNRIYPDGQITFNVLVKESGQTQDFYYSLTL